MYNETLSTEELVDRVFLIVRALETCVTKLKELGASSEFINLVETVITNAKKGYLDG